MTEAVAAELRALLAHRRLSVRAFARDYNLPLTTLHKTLSGSRAIDVEDLARICEPLGADPADIVDAAWRSTLSKLRASQIAADERDLETISQDGPPAVIPMRRRDVGGRTDTDLETVELDITQLAASKDNTPIDPSRGEAN